MNKKAAIGIAGGLVASLMAGVVALSMGRGLVGAQAKTVATPKPIVKTVTRVITVHKQRPRKASPVQTITIVRRSAGSGSTSALAPSSAFRDDGADSPGEGKGGGDD